MTTTLEMTDRDVSGAAESDPRWAQVLARDPSADGQFWYSVRTTGIYCRPSCPSRPHPKNVRLHASLAEARTTGFRPCKRCDPDGLLSSPETRVAKVDWAAVFAELDAQGWAVLPKLLGEAECDSISGLYSAGQVFRSHVVMGRYGFGQGEYRYFSYPLPPLVQGLRTAIYPRLVPLANRWHERMGRLERFPDEHAAFIERCHRAGQTRPTPLLLQYGPGDYNCLHQDLYGEQVFPLQVAIPLSEPGTDFEGGEFVLTEQRPRMQTRPAVVPLTKGDAVIFAVNSRPVVGSRGDYQVKLRHGVSKLRSGHRHTLGIIFHDAT